MRIVPVGEVWGIGARTTAKLNQLGIHTVWDLAIQPSQRIQAQFNVVVARTVYEAKANVVTFEGGSHSFEHMRQALPVIERLIFS
jgi:nucleotidyltransferase/DNA polymerase involved in DNA repair